MVLGVDGAVHPGSGSCSGFPTDSEDRQFQRPECLREERMTKGGPFYPHPGRRVPVDWRRRLSGDGDDVDVYEGVTDHNTCVGVGPHVHILSRGRNTSRKKCKHAHASHPNSIQDLSTEDQPVKTPTPTRQRDRITQRAGGGLGKRFPSPTHLPP